MGDTRPDNLIMAIAQGVDRTTNEYHVSMPAFANELNDEQIASVSNYVLQHFGNQAVKVTAQQVRQVRAGGPAPFLISAMPYLLSLAGLVALVLVVLAARCLRRRRG